MRRDRDPTDVVADTVVAGDTDRDGAPVAMLRPSASTVVPDDYPTLVAVAPEHYAMDREIARGGMGRIRIARDRRLGREVAVKELLVTTDVLTRRFEREARITAQLQHPSIVAVYEAGVWPSGEPFYAMRLVSGRSLDEAIGLATTYRARVALVPCVLAIADAMAYAHGLQVIHRDLKPRNVVVGEFGETVVIDWGLAKQLGGVTATLDVTVPDDGTRGTGNASQSGAGDTTLGDVLGTPGYMPPEQAAGEPVDERADVYAIGAILYHVLAGQAPFVAASNAMVLVALHEGPPPPLGARVPEAPRELVAIVERAMARDPAARYPTARALAEDLRRFQNGQLVGAHQYSARQLAARWLRRHRTLVTALAVATAVALGIGGVALRRVVRAERIASEQRARAQTNQQSAEQLLQFMLGDLRAKLATVGRLDLLDDVARHAIGYYDSRGEDGSAADLAQAATARRAISDVVANRGDLRGALAQAEQARALATRAAVLEPEVTTYRLRVAQATLTIGDIQASQGDQSASLATHRDVLAMTAALHDAAPDDPELVHLELLAHRAIAANLQARGDGDGALVELRAALALAERAVVSTRAPGTAASLAAGARKDLLIAHASIGSLLRARSDAAGALAEYRLALTIGEEESARDPLDKRWLADLATSHQEVGTVLQDGHDLDGALAEFRASAAISDRLLALDPANTSWRTSSGVVHERLGMVLFERQDFAGALAEFAIDLEISKALAASDPSNTEWQRNLSVSLNKRGDAQLATEDLDGAIASFREALAIRTALVARDPSNAGWRRDLFYSHYKLAGAFANDSHHTADALTELQLALQVAEDNVKRSPTNGQFLRDVAGTHQSIGDLYAALHDTTAARAAYQRGLALATPYLTGPAATPPWVDLGAKLQARLAALP
ncbi:MAG: protein kinase [Deltaproteobacteria bacterium]|nr:protein kinase [Deltaproteobacteria bacterium]